MMNKFFHLLVGIFLFAGIAEAKIIKIFEIQDIKKEITPQTWIFFNIAEVLMDTNTSLGSQAWRKYLRNRLDSNTHDQLTLFVFKNLPPKVPEDITPELILNLQNAGFFVFAFTSRGRNEWYGTQVAGIDQLTEDQLRKLHINFAKTLIPEKMQQLNSDFSDYYHDGIIYATNAKEKGEMLEQFLKVAGCKPSKIVFLDDKEDSLKSIELIAQKNHIEFTGFAYGRTMREHANFDPMIANIQLDWLIKCGKILSDAEAAKIKNEKFLNVDPELYFLELIDRWKNSNNSLF